MGSGGLFIQLLAILVPKAIRSETIISPALHESLDMSSEINSVSSNPRNQSPTQIKNDHHDIARTGFDPDRHISRILARKEVYVGRLSLFSPYFL